jgi:hypothetical protein
MINIVCDVCGNKLPIMGDKQNRKSTTLRVGFCGYCETMAMKCINLYKERCKMKDVEEKGMDIGDCEDNCQNGVELPLYLCHKKVRAAKITAIESHESNGEGSHTMIFGEIGGSKFLTDAWKDRFRPEVGGYFVQYEDGYTRV